MDRLRLILVAAHSDEADIYACGTAALLTERGSAVKFLSIISGDAGHYEIGVGMQLARRRWKEAQQAAESLGIQKYRVLKEYAGELYPTKAVRVQVIEGI